MANILVTGSAGFKGSWLCERYLQRENFEVFGTVRDTMRSNTRNLRNFIGHKRFHLVELNLTDYGMVQKIIRETEPDIIHNTAAETFVPRSFDAPIDTFDVNVKGVLHILEAVRHSKLNPVCQSCGSSEEFGFTYPSENPLNESSPTRPASPYGASKLAAEILMAQYHHSFGMKTILTRSFNCLTADTPILIRGRDGFIDIQYIGDIRKPRIYWAGKPNYKSTADKPDIWNLNEPASMQFEIWDGECFTPARQLFAYKYKGEISRLVTRAGTIDVTPDHPSLVTSLDNNGQLLIQQKDSSTLVQGDKLLLGSYPKTTGLTTVHPELAWLYGFFVADGSVRTYGERPSKATKATVQFHNLDEILLKQVETLARKHFGVSCQTIAEDRNGCLRLKLHSNNARWLPLQFVKMFYASNGTKKIPRIILNASRDTMRSFLDGYNAGDGLKAGHCVYEFKNFGTNSPILALGLMYLVSDVTGQRPCFNVNTGQYVRQDGGVTITRQYSINLNSPDGENPTHNGEHLKKPDDEIKKILTVPYDGYVYDLRVDSHKFQAGTGRIVTRNCDGARRGKKTAMSSFARQIVQIERKERQPVVTHGLLESVRDYTHIEDMITAYMLSVSGKCQFGTPYVIGSGEGHSAKELLDALVARSTMRESIILKHDPAKDRISDIPIMISDSTKFRAATGWKPTLPFSRMPDDILEFWRGEPIEESA